MKISIDCWGTILKSSPTFLSEKRKLVNKYIPCTDDYIDSCFSMTKKVFNDVIENSGGCQPSTDYIFTYLLSKLNGSYDSFSFLNEFINDYQKLAIANSPIVYSNETKEALEKLSQKHTLIISSNTMLISGNTLKFCLDHVGIGKYFSHFNFSDNLKKAKPHKAMYHKSNFHIGDNIITDKIGAVNAGSKPIIINSTNLTITDAINIILQ